MSWMQMPEGLEKLRVELPNHPHVTGETMWGKDVGRGRYEIRNVPFHAYGLNFRDVVEVAEGAEGEPPCIRRVHRRSGHRTLRVCFTEAALLEERVPSLLTLRRHGATFEGASQSYFAIDVDPLGTYASICEQLELWQEQGLLSFETCEAPEVGPFDAPAGRHDLARART
jgi:hypothetical protein